MAFVRAAGERQREFAFCRFFAGGKNISWARKDEEILFFPEMRAFKFSLVIGLRTHVVCTKVCPQIGPILD